MNFEPAFPDTSRPGMCMRDYIAIKAMAALVSDSKGLDPADFASIAADAYEMADAMLEARDKKLEAERVRWRR